jgi:hypothetical protein
MSCNYCNCCPNVVEHIAQHYDPDGLTMPHDRAEEVLAILRNCDDGMGEPCPLTLEDVQEYLEAIGLPEDL